MTKEEWIELAYLIENCWRGEFDDDRAAAYYEFLQGYDAELVKAALHALVQDPKPFVPAVSEIVQAIKAVTVEPTPPWTEAWQAIERSMAYRPDEMALEWLRANHHALVLAFVQAEGLSTLRRLPVYDGDHGGATMTMLQKRWADFIERSEERARRGQALGSAERAGIGLSKIKGLPGAPVAELGAGE